MKRLGGILAAAVLAVGGAALTALPAQAASTYMQVCNSTDGLNDITVWKTDSSYSKVLNANGSCTGDLYNANNSVRVDTRAAVSYKIKPIGIGYSGTYGPWHCNGGIRDSDPPNASQVYYKTSTHNECN